jgi:hypothetical protein
MGMGIPKPNAGAQKPNIAGKGPGIPQQVQQKPAMNAPQNLPRPIATQNPAMGSNTPAPGGKAAGPQQMPSAMGGMAAQMLAQKQMPQQPGQQPAAPAFYGDYLKSIQGMPPQMPQPTQQNDLQMQLMKQQLQGIQPGQQTSPQQLQAYQQMVNGQQPSQPGMQPQGATQQQIPQGQMDYFKQMLGAPNQPGPGVDGAQPYAPRGPSPIFNNPYLQGRPQMPGMGKGAMGKGMPAQGGKGLPAPGGKGYGPRQLPYESQRSFNQQMPQRQMSDMSGLASLFNRHGGTD